MHCIIACIKSNISSNQVKSIYKGTSYCYSSNRFYSFNGRSSRLFKIKPSNSSFHGQNWQTQKSNSIIPRKINHSLKFTTIGTENKTREVKVDFTDEKIQNINQLYVDTLQVYRTQVYPEDDNDDHESSVYHGLVADRNFTKGDLIISGKVLSISSVKCAHSIQIGYDAHAIMDMPAILINHSCNANVGLIQQNYNNYDTNIDNDKVCYNFYAIQNIPKGKELCCDYETVEYEIENFPLCSCGAQNCRKHIRGFRHNGNIVEQLYGSEYIAKYLNS